jgi:hypothetical protein
VIVVGILRTNGPESTLVRAIASRAAQGGARVEVVGLVPAGPEGDALLLELSTAGVGHATVLRHGGAGLEPADLDLALRYVPDLRVVVLVKSEPGLLPTVAAAAEWAGGSMILIAGQETSTSDAPVPERSIVLAPPAADPDGTFAGFVAALAVELDSGAALEVAWRSTVAALAVDPANGGRRSGSRN